MCWWTSEEARGRKVAHRYCLRSPAVACRCRVSRQRHVSVAGASRARRAGRPAYAATDNSPLHTDTKKDKQCKRDHSQSLTLTTSYHTRKLAIKYGNANALRGESKGNPSIIY